MSLNIKNERVHELVREAARMTGKSQTGVVEEALRRYLDELGAKGARSARDCRLAEFYAELDASGIAARIPASTDFLYDADTGLPA